MTYQQWPGQQTPQAPKKKSRATAIVLGVLGLVVAAGVVYNVAGGGTPDRQIAPVAQPAAPVVQQAPTAVAPPVGAQDSFGDGTWVVGTDIQPGTYRSPGAIDDTVDFCSYSRLKTASSDGDRLSWGTAQANEPILIEIKASDAAFKASGCETFTKVG